MNGLGTAFNSGIVEIAHVAGGLLVTTGVITYGVENWASVLAEGSISDRVLNHVGASFGVTGPLSAKGNFTNAGSLDVRGGDLVDISLLDNSGSVTIGDGRRLSAARIESTGSIVVGAAGKLEGTGNSLTNSGTIVVGTNGSIVDAGTITNRPSGVINLDGAGGTAVIASSGAGGIVNDGTVNVIAGGASFVGDVTNTGIIASWAGAGPLSFSGNYTSLGSSSFLNGSTTDRLIVRGTYSGGGMLLVDANTATGQGDRIEAKAANAASATAVWVNMLQSGIDAVTLVKTESGSTDAFRLGGQVDATGRVLSTGRLLDHAAGLVHYQLQRDAAVPGNVVVQPSVDGPALSGFAGIASALATVSTAFHQPPSGHIAWQASGRENELRYGIWARGDGGRLRTYDTTILQRGGALFQAPAEGRPSIHYEGIESGADAAVLHVAGSRWNVHGGISGGTVSGRIRTPGFKSDVELPFIGGYLLATDGAFTVDLNARHAWHTVELSSPVFGDGLAHSVDGSAATVATSVSYRFAAGGWTVSPSAGLAYTRLDLDPFLTGGGLARFDAGGDEALVGRLGLKIGHAVAVSPSLVLEPHAGAIVSRNFTNTTDATLAITSSAGTVAVLDARTESVRDAVAFSAGVTALETRLGMSAFVEGTVRHGDRISGGSVTAGGRIGF